MSPEETTPEPIIGATLEGLRRAAQEVETERSLAQVLQRSLLRQRLPENPGLRLAARYMPGSSEAHVGGDWYDAVPLRDGRMGLVIGDVVGRGVGAASLMAHLQAATRAYALEGLRPSLVLERTDAFAHDLEQRGMATLLYCVLDADAGTLRFASAGHLLPLVVAPHGEAEFAEGTSGSPLGVIGFPAYEEITTPLEPGSVVLLFTDGLVERPGISLEEGLAVLRESAAAIGADAEALCRQLPEAVLDGPPEDDAALIAVLLEPVGDELELTLPAESGSLAQVRGVLARWLRAAGASDVEMYEVLVAAGEACSNAIAHAYPAGDASFDLRAHRRGAQVQLVVRDHGTWRPARGQERRRGLTLMEELMDAVELDRRDHGTTVTLSRRLEGAIR